MHTEHSITIRGDIDHIFAVASAVETWPHLLPHVRLVTVLSEDLGERLVAMVADRDGFPVRWTARVCVDLTHHRMHLTHVRGISRGMEVTWFFDADGPLVQVRIVHDLTWRWWPLGPWIADSIIGTLFVRHFAFKTLGTLKHALECQGPEEVPNHV